MSNPGVTVDTETYIAALTQQRNGALDAVAQLEGVIGMLRKEIVGLKQQIESASAKPATTNLYTTPPAEPTQPAEQTT